MTWSSSILGWMLDASWPCRFDSELYRCPMVSCLTSALAKCHVGIGENDHVKPAAKVVQKIKRKRIRNSIQKWAAVYGPLEITFQPLLSAVKGLSFHVSFRICPIQPHSNYIPPLFHRQDWQRLTAKQSRSCLRFETCQLIALVLIGRNGQAASVTLKLRHSFDKARLWSGSKANAPSDMHRRSLPRRQGRWHPHRWCPSQKRLSGLLQRHVNADSVHIVHVQVDVVAIWPGSEYDAMNLCAHVFRSLVSDVQMEPSCKAWSSGARFSTVAKATAPRPWFQIIKC